MAIWRHMKNLDSRRLPQLLIAPKPSLCYKYIVESIIPLRSYHYLLFASKNSFNSMELRRFDSLVSVDDSESRRQTATPQSGYITGEYHNRVFAKTNLELSH